MATDDLVTEGQIDALIEAIAARGSSKLYTGTDAYDAGLLAAVHTGDYFMYNDGGLHPGWLYVWGGTDWTYAGNLKGADGVGGSSGIDGGTWDTNYGGATPIDGGTF